MANPFVHVELHTKDLAKAKTFYGQLFGWQLQDTPMPGGGGTYTMIGVDDLEAMTERAKELGATVLQDVMEVGEYGSMSVIRDPTGAVLALWKAKAG